MAPKCWLKGDRCGVSIGSPTGGPGLGLRPVKGGAPGSPTGGAHGDAKKKNHGGVKNCTAKKNANFVLKIFLKKYPKHAKCQKKSKKGGNIQCGLGKELRGGAGRMVLPSLGVAQVGSGQATGKGGEGHTERLMQKKKWRGPITRPGPRRSRGVGRVCRGGLP